MDFQFVFSLLVLLFSVVIHEVSHGYAALMQGDKTAEYAHRLTLNPLRHIDLVGTIILPAVSLMLPGSFLFGWAKPVPYNPYNLRNQRWGELWVALAGPLSNIVIAAIFGFFMRFYVVPSGLLMAPLGLMSATIVIVNVTLAVFNMMPIPPLDGSKVLSALIPRSLLPVRTYFERFGFVGVLIFVIIIWQFIYPIIPWLFSAITGVAI
ncbi:MAG: site-2 protease family protein [Candidatus Paceibacterota bacterium]|jgi:Zn-dependent protease